MFYPLFRVALSPRLLLCEAAVLYRVMTVVIRESVNFDPASVR